MKKTLFLLRHAQALSSSGGGDIDRKLSPTGLGDAAALANYMCAQNYHPDLVLCSSAVRTKQTFEQICKAYDALDVKFSKDIYDASVNTLFDIVRSVKDNVESLLIIGHNPTIHSFAAQLCSKGPDRLLQRVTQGYAPATLSVIELPCEGWSDLDYDSNTLADLVNPMDYNAPETPARWT